MLTPHLRKNYITLSKILVANIRWLFTLRFSQDVYVGRVDFDIKESNDVYIIACLHYCTSNHAYMFTFIGVIVVLYSMVSVIIYYKPCVYLQSVFVIDKGITRMSYVPLGKQYSQKQCFFFKVNLSFLQVNLVHNF